MTAIRDFSESELNALLDGRLDQDELDHLEERLGAAPEVSEQLRRMAAVQGLIGEHYQRLRIPAAPGELRPSPPLRWQAIAASLVLALVGATAGWWMASSTGNTAPTSPPLAGFRTVHSDAGKILLHISTADPDRIDAALDTAERLLVQNHSQDSPTRLEIIANADGLAMLRDGSPYTDRIQKMVARYQTVSFKACGIAMETARLKEGVEVRLIPQAQRVNAALDEILTRLQEGWTYIRA